MAARPLVGFDLDGTLVDSAADIAAAVNAALADVGLAPHSLAVVRGFIGDGARVLIERALLPHGASGDVDAVLARFRAHYGKDPVGQTRAFAGVTEAIADLAADCQLAVVTNKPGVFARPIVAALFPGRFALVVGPDDLSCQKPDPRVLAIVRERVGAPVRVFVGDGGTDVEVARAAGVPSVGVLWGLRPDEARSATVTVDAVAELPAAVRALL